MALAVLDIQNSSNYDVGFDFRWSSSSPWTYYSEAPGQSQVISTNYSSSLSPQALYDMTPSPYSEVEVSLVQGYSEWNGSGTPPASAATLYAFENTRTGVELYYISTPTPHRPRRPTPRPRRPTPTDPDARTDPDPDADADPDTGAQSRRRNE